MPPQGLPNDGISHVPSKYSVPETLMRPTLLGTIRSVDQLLEILASKRARGFTRGKDLEVPLGLPLLLVSVSFVIFLTDQ